ncbi:hypothetical protein KAX97_02975 [candidate division WOR-3 bacterium]|nr:hypothetical protein [candidate division WOR-3 bacterium]
MNKEKTKISTNQVESHSLTIFNSDFDAFSRKYLDTNYKLAIYEKRLFPQKYKQILASLFEQLLLFDRISFKVYGENIPLAILINTLGIKQVEELIEEKVIEFVLWTPDVTYNEAEIEGLLPLQSINLTSPAHSDPEESINLGLKWLKDQPTRKDRRMLQRKIKKNYKIPEDNFSHDAARLVIDAYNSNKLEDIGMPKIKDILKLSKSERRKLCEYASDVLETTILSRYGYSSFEKYNYYSISLRSFSNIQKAFNIVNNFNKILTLEKIPDLKILFYEKKLDLKSIVKLRRKSISIKFRRWLHSVSNNSGADNICKEYIDAIVQTKGYFESGKGKFIKTLSLFTLSIEVGGLIAGLPGMILGVPLAKMIEPAADFGLDLIDTYFLDGVLRGWNPRLFISEMIKNVNKRNASS